MNIQRFNEFGIWKKIKPTIFKLVLLELHYNYHLQGDFCASTVYFFTKVYRLGLHHQYTHSLSHHVSDFSTPLFSVADKF